MTDDEAKECRALAAAYEDIDWGNDVGISAKQSSDDNKEKIKFVGNSDTLNEFEIPDGLIPGDAPDGTDIDKPTDDDCGDSCKI